MISVPSIRVWNIINCTESSWINMNCPEELKRRIVAYEQALLSIYKETDEVRALRQRCVEEWGEPMVRRCEFEDFEDVLHLFKQVVSEDSIKAMARHSYARRYYSGPGDIQTQIERQERLMLTNAKLNAGVR